MGVATCSNDVATPTIFSENRRIWTNKILKIELEMNVSGLQKTGYAGGETRTLLNIAKHLKPLLT